MGSRANQKYIALITSLLACALGGGCAGFSGADQGYAYFTPPAPDDQWSPKISGWQRRERAQDRALVLAPAAVSQAAPVDVDRVSPVEPAPVQAGVLDLRSKYAAFRADQKRAMARSVAAWTQSPALEHYMEDGPVDH